MQEYLVTALGKVAKAECAYHVQLVFPSGETEFISRGQILTDTYFGISAEDLQILHDAVEQYWLEHPAS